MKWLTDFAIQTAVTLVGAFIGCSVGVWLAKVWH